MIVIADASPLIVLIKIEEVAILPKLFGHILLPQTVASELADSRRPQAVRDFIHTPPAWISVRTVGNSLPLPGLHLGESEAINLARQLSADLILMDERDAVATAREMGLRVVGTVGILERAAQDRLLNLREAFDRLKATDFWVSPKLLEERLHLFEQCSRADRNRPKERER